MYLGDDMPDPGLVLAGTKCADGKVSPRARGLQRPGPGKRCLRD